MNTKLLTLVFFSLLVSHSCVGVELPGAEKDLSGDWLVFEGGQFVSFESRQSRTEIVYLNLDSRKLAGHDLIIKGVRAFNVFINNNLTSTGRDISLSIDSLASLYSSHNLLVAIQQRNSNSRHSDLKTLAVSPHTGDPLTEGLVKREGSFFRDFGVLAILLMMGLGVYLVRLNPKLASDYFSVRGIFSTRETQDSQVYTRIGSSTNILFYAYCSMLLAYYLIVIFHFTANQFPVANLFQGAGFGGTVVQWLELSLYLMIFLFMKIILVFGASYLFGIPEVAGIHFFNWVRLLLVFFGLLTIFLFVYFIWHGQSVGVHVTMLKLLGWIFGGWIILIFFKLSGNASASMFHLFSYICATELIPFLFIIKVLYK